MSDREISEELTSSLDRLVEIGQEQRAREDGYDTSDRDIDAEAAAIKARLIAACNRRAPAAQPASEGVRLIAEERQRQVSAEGWTAEHDNDHDSGQLADAAMCYIATAIGGDEREAISEGWWPWAEEWWKPSTPVRMLVKAGALVAAEIDRLLREGGKP